MLIGSSRLPVGVGLALVVVVNTVAFCHTVLGWIVRATIVPIELELCGECIHFYYKTIVLCD